MLDELDRRLLKEVVGLAVRTAGGQENAVNVTTRINRPAAFSDYANKDLDNRQCPIDVALELDQFNPEPLILRTMARMAGHALVQLPRVAGGRLRLDRIVGQAMKETADVFARYGQMLDDGVLDAVEGPQFDREIDEAIEKLLALKLQARAVIDNKGER